MKTDKELYEKFRSWCELGSIGCFAPGKNPTLSEVNKAWEELHYYTVGQLDKLLSILVGGNIANPTKEASLKKLQPIYSKMFGGVTLQEPKFISEARGKEVAKAQAASLLMADQLDEDTHMTEIIEPKKAKKKTAIVAAAKPGKAEKKPATKTRGRSSSTNEDAKITLLMKENPKREGSAGHKAFSLYSRHKTVGAFLSAGGTRADLRYDEAKGFIKIK